MSNSLDLKQQDFKKILDRSSEVILKFFEKIKEQKGFYHYPQKEIENWFKEPVPLEGMDFESLISEVQEKVIDKATGNAGPNMYAYVMAGGNQLGIISEKISATINQNVAKWHLAPSITEIEKRVIQWTAEMIGFGKDVGGFLVTSGSAANFDSLTVARNIHFEKLGIREKGLFNVKPFTVYCSDETHSCVDKSIQILGIGSDHLRKISTNNDFQIDLIALEDQIQEDVANGFHPFCVVGNAGTVNTGAIDNLIALATLAKKYKMWFHVDGAYGGIVAALESKSQLYNGINQADSIALDFHKWLYQPFEVGCFMVKSWDQLNQSYFKKASYLDTSLETRDNRLDFNEHHFLLSRNAKALKVWMSLKFYGLNKIMAMVQKDIDLTNYLNERVAQESDFELVAKSELAISCFRYIGKQSDESAIDQINKRMIPVLEKDGRVFITGTTIKGKFVLRACIINHRKTEQSIDFLIDVIREIGSNIESKKQYHIKAKPVV